MKPRSGQASRRRRRPAPTGRARPRGGGGSAPRRSRRGGDSKPPITISGSSTPAGRPPTRRCVRVAFSPQTTQIAVSIVISSDRARSSGIGPNGRPAKSVLRPLAMTWRPLWRSVSATWTGCRRRTGPPRCRPDRRRARARARGSRRARRAGPAPTDSGPCSGSPRTRRGSGRRHRAGRAGSGDGRSRRGAGGAAARPSCPTTCSRRSRAARDPRDTASRRSYRVGPRRAAPHRPYRGAVASRRTRLGRSLAAWPCHPRRTRSRPAG